MNMELLFNLLSIANLIVVAVILVQVSRLTKYVRTPSWAAKVVGWSLVLLSTVLSALNVYLVGGGLNWLGIINQGVRLAAVLCLSHSYGMMEIAFKRIIQKLRETPPIVL